MKTAVLVHAVRDRELAAGPPLEGPRDDQRGAQAALNLRLARAPRRQLSARDHQRPIGDACEYARRLRAPLRAIADCGHLLIGERPDACADAIERFLAESR